MNKMLCKIICIISFVFAVMYFAVFVSLHFLVSYNYFANNIQYYVVLIGMGIASFACTCAGFTFYNYRNLSLEQLKSKKNCIIIWSSIFIFICNACSILGLILYVILFDNIFVTNKHNYLDEIVELEKLKKDGLITDTEFKAKKKKLLNI